MADLAGLLRGKEGVCTDELAHVDGWSAAFDRSVLAGGTARAHWHRTARILADTPVI